MKMRLIACLPKMVTEKLFLLIVLLQILLCEAMGNGLLDTLLAPSEKRVKRLLTSG